MYQDGILPDEVTFACILNACDEIGAVDKRKKVNESVSRRVLLEHEIVLGGALVHMYGDCGTLCQVQSVL